MHTHPPTLSPILLTRQDAARLLSVSLRSIDGWIASGAIPVVRKGLRCVRIRYADLLDFSAKDTFAFVAAK